MLFYADDIILIEVQMHLSLSLFNLSKKSLQLRILAFFISLLALRCNKPQLILYFIQIHYEALAKMRMDGTKLIPTLVSNGQKHALANN